MTTKVERTGEFDALGTTGNSYRLIQTTLYRSHGPLTEPTARWLPDPPKYRLDTGQVVSEIADGVYVILATGERLARRD